MQMATIKKWLQKKIYTMKSFIWYLRKNQKLLVVITSGEE